MLKDLLIPFFSLLIAETADKTQLAIISLSSKYKRNPFQIFFGVIIAFLIVDGLAIYFADEIKNLMPIIYVKIISGLIFILFGLFGLYFSFKKNNDSSIINKTNKFKSPFLNSFMIIFFAEFGDKSQITAGLFATIYNPTMVFIGVILSLSLITIISIFIGEFIVKKISKKKIDLITDLIFIFIGFITLLSIF